MTHYHLDDIDNADDAEDYGDDGDDDNDDDDGDDQDVDHDMMLTPKTYFRELDVRARDPLD